MTNYEKDRNRRLYETVSITKLIAILFCGVIIFSVYGERFGSFIIEDKPINLITLLLIVISIFILMYQIWIISNEQKKMVGLNRRTILETFIFIIFFSILVVISGGYESQYKMIFIFIIATSTIEFGKNTGIFVASICGALLLIMDLFFAPKGVNNPYFQADIMLTGTFILVSWLLGVYVDIEEKYRIQLMDIANIDDLTGVYNHRFFQQTITIELEKARDNNYPVSLLFVDLDHFKQYNDLYGHMEGDKLLTQLATLIDNKVRKKDVVARYGGDEFAVILSGIGEKEAVFIGEGIRKEIDETYFKGEEHLSNKKITASIGVSYFPGKAKTKDDLIRSADDALYRAKFFNKNRVEVYFSVLEELKEDLEEEHIDTISSIKTLISLINAKDKYTYGHTERVVIYCDLIAKKLGLSGEDKKILKYGAYLHDIGKVEVSQEILNKKMSLTQEEWECIKRHPESGAEIIKLIPALKSAIPLVRHHHERFDGTGYPSQLKGEEIPFLTRILSLADSFDAMTSNRPYKGRKSYGEAMDELRRCKGSQFDPQLVEVFIEALKENQ